EGSIYRDYAPADLTPELEHTGVGGTVLVQSDPLEAHTRELLKLARAHDFILGVVGWLDLESLDIPNRIEEFAADPKLVGLRAMIHNIPDIEWMLNPDLELAFDSMIAHDLTFDALVRPQHLRALLKFCERYSDLRVVIDHGAKPRIRQRDFSDWAARMRTLARETNAWCKISGLVTEAGSADPDMLKPYVDHLVDCFGPQRLLWGSDWPVCEGICNYRAWYGIARSLLADLSTTECDALFGGVARNVYRLNSPTRTRDPIASDSQY
ncbi:MAG TPA: amidohydrolase family protein, partial [Steroidobacteraceae bacterium]|nr:amidohydrolase family protein [Steroidobacteraceae bacterium]